MSDPVFSGWAHWNQRSLIEGRNRPGVYLLGRFEDGPPAAVDDTDEHILLIGETHNQTLGKRWDQFHYCAFRGGDGHAGGRTFHRLYSNGPDSEVPPWLFLAANPFDGAPADAQISVQAMKNRLLQVYVERHGSLPPCNMRGPVEHAPVTNGYGRGETEVGEDSPVKDTAPPRPPQIAFQQWSPWLSRGDVMGIDAAGVYALALFDSAVPTDVDLLDERVIYFGETCDNSLHGRLAQFHRSAFLAKSGHSGGWSYRSRRGDAGEHLFVAVFPVSELEEPHRSSFIRHIERKLLWEYVVRWGRRPLCNSK